MDAIASQVSDWTFNSSDIKMSGHFNVCTIKCIAQHGEIIWTFNSSDIKMSGHLNVCSIKCITQHGEII